MNKIVQKISLSMFGLAMLNVAAVMSLRGIPIIAETGLTMFFYLFIAAAFFLVPVSLIAAELATTWPGPGGVYRWIKIAFGSRWGFLAIWLQWIQNVIWYPTILAFAAGAFAYLFLKPELATNNYYTFCFIIIVYWLATFLSFTGLKMTSHFTSFGVIVGTVIPGLFIIGLGILWVVIGEPVYFLQQPIQWIPDLSNFSNIAFLAGIVLLFAGMEVGAVHVIDLKNPKKDYPKSIFLSMLIIVVIFSLGSLAVAAVIPKTDISLTAGIMEAFSRMLEVYNIGWLIPILGFLVSFGAIAGVTAWIAGPSKGLLATAKNGEIPPFLSHVNKNGVQTHILIIQGVIVSILSLLYLIMDNVSVAFFLLSAITVILYLVMYFLLFLAGIKLRYSQPDVPRGYKVPGGMIGMWLISGIGMVTVIFAFILGFIPPAELKVTSPILYFIVVVSGVIIFIGASLFIHAFKKPDWKKKVL